MQSEVVGLLTIKADYSIYTDIITEDGSRLIVDSKTVAKTDVRGDVFMFETYEGVMWAVPIPRISAIKYPESK